MIQQTMKAAYLPGNSTVEIKEVDIPDPGHGEVLIQMKASTICGSDIRAIYHEHIGEGAEAYQNKIAGHEPCGKIVKTGSGTRQFKTGDRVVVYHISGCGICYDCRRGFMINCTTSSRAAYGWQRDGGMAEYLLAEEKDLCHLPDELSYIDGAQVACGFGTVYEGLDRIGISGNDDVLITGLGPVGLAAAMLCRALGANRIFGIDINQGRLDIAKNKGLCDELLIADPSNVSEIYSKTSGHGVEKAVDCSGNIEARLSAIKATREWGKIVFIGEGGKCSFNPSPDIIHGQKTIIGSWVTSIWKMEELLEHIVRWGIHPEELVTHRFEIDQIQEAFDLMAKGKCGKVAVCFN